MISRILVAGVLSLPLILLAPPQLVEAQQRPRPPSEAHASIRSVESVPMERMPSVDSETLPQSPADRIGPYPYGTVLETRLTPDRHGLWEQLPSGDWLWRLRLHSDNAVSLSVSFTQFRLPDGASVFLHGPDDATIRGPYTNDDVTSGQHWTALVQGDVLTIEVEVPRNQRSAVQLEVGRVIHGIRSLLPTANRNPSSKSGTCNLDVACEEADPWREQVRSVGMYSYVDGDFAFRCSGSLMNNTAEDETPYFLTAEHCIQTPSQASSMVFYWNFQTAQCRRPGSEENGTFPDDSLDVDAWNQTSSGADLRARYGNTHEGGNITGKPDLSLVQVDDEIPDRYNLYFSGWSRQGMGTSEGVTIHHPAGHGKRISFDDDPTTITAYDEVGEGNTHLRVGNWEIGTTEGGSSGAPLFNANQYVVGVLSGGYAGCDGDGDADDNNEPDWYGRIAPGFENGDYTPPGAQDPATLAEVLDPLNTGAEVLDGLPQSAGIDQIPPARVQDPRVHRVNTRAREVTLRWTAPGDDGDQGTAARYDLRYDTTRIQSADDFQQAQRVTDPPLPSRAGQLETVVVDDSDGLRSNRQYYFAVVAVDEAGNRSPQTSTDQAAFLVQQIEIGEGGVTTGAGSSIAETRFILNQTQDVQIALFDLLGRRVRVVFDQRVSEGFEQRVQFDTGSLSSGPYFLRFVGENFATTRKFVVVR